MNNKIYTTAGSVTEEIIRQLKEAGVRTYKIEMMGSGDTISVGHPEFPQDETRRPFVYINKRNFVDMSQDEVDVFARHLIESASKAPAQPAEPYQTVYTPEELPEVDEPAIDPETKDALAAYVSGDPIPPKPSALPLEIGDPGGRMEVIEDRLVRHHPMLILRDRLTGAEYLSYDKAIIRLETGRPTGV